MTSEVYDKCHLYRRDYLTSQSRRKYDLIIGNPPYFEISNMKQRTPDRLDRYKKDFKAICQGRTNIYSLFLYKSIQKLKKNGLLVFVIPNSIRTSATLQKLRNYIYQECVILEIQDCGAFSDMTQQDVCIFVCRKKKNKSEPQINIYTQRGDMLFLNPLWKQPSVLMI